MKICPVSMSKRKNMRKPAIIISDEEEDFVLPAAKRSKSSSQTRKARVRASDRALNRDLERAKEISLGDSVKNSKTVPKQFSACEGSDSSISSTDFNYSAKKRKEVSKDRRVSRPINTSSQSDIEATARKHNMDSVGQNGSIFTSPQDKLESDSTTCLISKVVSKVKSCLQTAHSDSDEEFKISEPESVENNSSDSEFKISQISDSISDEAGRVSGSEEEFHLRSEDKKSVVQKSKKSKSDHDKRLIRDLTVKTESVKTKLNETNCIPVPDSTSKAQNNCDMSNEKRNLRAVRPKKILLAKTVNIPAILSSSQSNFKEDKSPSGVKIGLSKKAKFKSLHVNVKRQ